MTKIRRARYKDNTPRVPVALRLNSHTYNHLKTMSDNGGYRSINSMIAVMMDELVRDDIEEENKNEANIS